MSVRVVARVRPLLKGERLQDVIVATSTATATAANGTAGPTGSNTVVRIPNPKNESEAFSFQFNSVYDQDATQAQIFDQEVSPTVKHLFKGYDVTFFAYGVTCSGKTHTMRGGKSLADRGVIPRLLSSIYRRTRKMEKDGAGETQVEVAMSYYEIYNDRVYDLFEPLEKRTPAGLPIRDHNGKTVVCGLTERPCTTLKEFEQLYDQANVNRSTSATKLNAHSSRSHAVLCVKVTQTTGDETRISTASAIDLAGSEDNRRTENNKERLVESASINKSLFVLAQCVEAISKKQNRIPYRESKMTRILSLGQNNGLTVMILNLAPVRSCHLDTMSSLNFANRTKKIEVNEVENQPFFRDPVGKSKLDGTAPGPLAAQSMHRQPLRPKLLSQNSHLRDVTANVPKPAKQFSVYADPARPSLKPAHIANTSQARTQSIRSPKRTSSDAIPFGTRPTKASRLYEPSIPAGLTPDAIEALIDRKLQAALAERVAAEAPTAGPAAAAESESHTTVAADMQKRLDALERRVAGHETSADRAEGLRILLVAKQHLVRGEEGAALRMFEQALPHFPDNAKLRKKVAGLKEKARTSGQPLPQQRDDVALNDADDDEDATDHAVAKPKQTAQRKSQRDGGDDDDSDDESYHAPDCPDVPYDSNEDDNDSDDDNSVFIYRPRTKIRRPQRPRQRPVFVPLRAPQPRDNDLPPPPPSQDQDEDEADAHETTQNSTPRTTHLLAVINSRDVGRIRLLQGVGAKRAQAIVDCLCEMDDDGSGSGDDDGGEDEREEDGRGGRKVTSLRQLGGLRGVGVRSVERMRLGIGTGA